ncbi:MAG: type II secretion system protein GspL [Pseudomonadota bacterium]
MTDLVVFRLGASPADPVAWGAFASGALSEAGRVNDVAALAAIKDRFAEGARLVAVLQGEQIAMREIAAPPRQSAKLLAAAGFLLEDELAEPVSDLHIVISTSEPRVAFAISKTLIENWLAAFAEAGVAVTEMCADFAAIGASSQTPVLVSDHGRIIASRGAAAFAAEADIAELMAPSFVEAAGETPIIAYGADAFSAAWTSKPLDSRKLSHEADLVAIHGAALSSKPAPANLLQGAYRRRAPQNFRFGAYRRPAILAASLAALTVFSAAAAGIKDARVAAIYEQSAISMHKAAFPTFAGDDIRGHSRQMLADGVKAASFLEMSARLAASLEGQDGIAIDRIRYDAARGQFMFSIKSNSDAGIEAFRAALDAQGVVAADNGGYRRSGEAWIGEMTARAK